MSENFEPFTKIEHENECGGRFSNCQYKYQSNKGKNSKIFIKEHKSHL